MREGEGHWRTDEVADGNFWVPTTTLVIFPSRTERTSNSLGNLLLGFMACVSEGNADTLHKINRVGD